MANANGLTAPAVPKTKSKLMRPDEEQNAVSDILKKNKRKRNKTTNGKAKGRDKKGKRARKGAPKGSKRNKKGKKGKKGSKTQKAEATTKADGLEEKEDIDPYLLLKETDSNALIKLFLHKLVDYPLVSEHLGQFGDQLQSSMISFASDMVLPTLMSMEHTDRFKSIINDRKLIYLLRQSFIRWLMVHRGQMKLVFKRKGDENAKNKLKYDVVVTKNHIIQKLSSASENKEDIEDIISKLSTETKSKWLHFLKSDIKNPFLAQLQTPIPSSLLPNTKSVIEEKKEEEKKEEEKKEEEKKEEEKKEEDSMDTVARLHNVFSGYKDCVLLSEKQVLVDILKTQYKLIQNAIDDYGKIRWMDAPIDAGHIGLMQRELMRDHSSIMNKCNLIESDFKLKLAENIGEVNKMRFELDKRKNMYLDLIENKCFKFLSAKLSAIHEEIERKKQAIALHEKKRENYLNHAKESLKNEENMRKGVDLVEATYHKYLRQMTSSKVEYAVIDDKLENDSFYNLQEKLNELRNKNDRYWYWYKKEKEIYSKSIKTLSRLNRFFKKIEEFLIKEYGESSQELITFRKEYYKHVLYTNLNEKDINNEYNKEIFNKKKIADIEIVYNMKKKDIKLPPHNFSVINRLYKRMRTFDFDINTKGMFLNNEIQKDKENIKQMKEEDKKQRQIDQEKQNKLIHSNDTDEEEEEEEEEEDYYTKTNDNEIFGADDEDYDDDEYDDDNMSYQQNINKTAVNDEWGSVVDDAVEVEPELDKHFSHFRDVKREEIEELYEDSKQYHHDEEEDDDERPSSTIFKTQSYDDDMTNKDEEEPEDDPVFFADSQFFNENNQEEEEEEEVLQVSGFARIKTTNIDDDINDDIVEEEPQPNEYVQQMDDEDDEEFSFEDDDDDDDIDEDEFEDDDDDEEEEDIEEDSYEDSSEWLRLMQSVPDYDK